MFGVTIFWIEKASSELAPFINPYMHPCYFTNMSSELKLKKIEIFVSLRFTTFDLKTTKCRKLL